jgi:hypothetical protein
MCIIVAEKNRGKDFSICPRITRLLNHTNILAEKKKG